MKNCHKKNKILKMKNVTDLEENDTGKADLGRSTSSKFTPGFYTSKPDNRRHHKVAKQKSPVKDQMQRFWLLK